MKKLLIKLATASGYQVRKMSKFETLKANELWDGRILNVKSSPYECTFLNHTLYVHDYESFLLGYFELFRDANYQFPADTETPLIIDCGANMGMSIIYFKMLYPKAKIIAFEADSHIFSFLKKNVQSYDFQDVTIYNNAVYDEAGKTLKFLPDGGAGGRLENEGEDFRMIRVDTIRLKDYLNQPVTFLKIDIEGVEDRVLKDCADKLHLVQFLHIEYHSFENRAQNLQNLLQIVTDAGFRYHIKEAYTTRLPFVERTLNFGMDLQLNLFCYR